MTADRLTPLHNLLLQEYVLVQAWKKTASYIRAHNWYADTLDLDRTAVNLPRFLADLADQLRAPGQWQSDPLRIVPAPKSQRWRVRNGTWEPVPLSRMPENRGKFPVKLRPLAHVSIRDQVAATAIMLCLADRVESIQGDPRGKVTDTSVRDRVVSYGNRLFCDYDETHQQLCHRWGSAKLYRAYAQDYRSFIARPEAVAESLGGRRVIIVHSDLRQFYDRVSCELLASKLKAVNRQDDDPAFHGLALRVLQWSWHRSDAKEVKAYAAQAGLADFSSVALPQGLVAAGFFANAVLLDFDGALKSAVTHEIAPGLVLHDACRYVDDLRIVLTDDQNRSLSEVETATFSWVGELLGNNAAGLEASRDKTLAVDFGGDERPLVRQSRRMNRIQTEVSGGFDATGGEDILDAVQGLIRSQQRYSEKRTTDEGWAFAPIADVRDDTVARFAAARYRTTYRSLRPMLADTNDTVTQSVVEEEDDAYTQHRRPRTRNELDDDARAFALGLIEQWIHDPSNVRLLRIGLDIWPAADVLTGVLDLLRPFTESGGRRNAPRRVAWYCLAEILRAGATETGFVEDSESLPSPIDIGAYRSRLKDEAIRLASLAPAALPWYLKQQTLLFLAATAPAEAPVSRTGRSTETRHYREMIRFLRGEGDRVTGADFATLSILARRSFLSRDAAVELAVISITPRRIEEVAERDPAFACEVLAARIDLVAQVSPRVRDDLCLAASPATGNRTSLACVVLGQGRTETLRNEVSLLRFAAMFLERLSVAPSSESAITPVDVWLTLADPSRGFSEKDTVEITPSRLAPTGSMYLPPLWCPPDERWRFQVGFLLRFILTAKQDFASAVQPPHWRESAATYRKPQGHWYQKVYGLFNGHSAFGDDWLPVSDWIERMLFALLSWPGCRYAEWGCVREGIGATRMAIEKRLLTLQRLQGPTKSTLLLPIRTSRPDRSTKDRPLRACVVQTVVPGLDDIKQVASTGDLSLSDPAFRARHRNHLSAALAAVERMLDLRETHLERGGRLDWLILPELSVHPRDVHTHLIPFARAHKTIILAGMTYQELIAGQPLVNSALWVIPVWSAAHGLQIVTRRQGKKHLAPLEQGLNSAGSLLQGFRPCQWLLGYEWSSKKENRPLWLTGAICYDATDINLAADLRDRSDVFAIPALNKDVTTFDQMALALHYHLFQLVIIANNGQFGGSNAYWPHKDPWTKQVFHLHGQPQASVAFLEIDDIADFVTRIETARRPSPPPSPEPAPSPHATSKWKPPPAGL